jgi:hypothetical protein
MNDPVNHPAHYTSHPSGVEAIAICEGFNFNVGNAIKYLWRAGLKSNAVEDLEKARWYVTRELQRITKQDADRCPVPEETPSVQPSVESGIPQPPTLAPDR